MKKQVLGFLVLSGIMILFLLFMAMPTFFGKTILLPLQPVDPFDPFRGQYLTLSYAINNPVNLPGLPKNIPDNAPVYVLFEENKEGIAFPVAAALQPLTRTSKQTLLRGRVEYGWIYYGIEAYFMEKGATLDTRLDGAVAKITVLPDGRASVVELLKDGKPLSFTYRKKSFLQK